MARIDISKVSPEARARLGRWTCETILFEKYLTEYGATKQQIRAAFLESLDNVLNLDQARKNKIVRVYDRFEEVDDNE